MSEGGIREGRAAFRKVTFSPACEAMQCKDKLVTKNMLFNIDVRIEHKLTNYLNTVCGVTHFVGGYGQQGEAVHVGSQDVVFAHPQRLSGALRVQQVMNLWETTRK